MDETKKIWWLAQKGKAFGPYSFFDLKSDARLTLHTYVWKEGFSDWRLAGDVDELSSLFEQKEKTTAEEEAEEEGLETVGDEAELVIAQDGGLPPYFWFLLLALLLCLFSLWYTFFLQ